MRFVHRAGRADSDVHRRWRLSATPKTKALCGCTEHGHAAVREAIRTPLPDGRKLLAIAEVFAT